MTETTGPSLVCPCGSPDVDIRRGLLCPECSAAVAEEAGGPLILSADEFGALSSVAAALDLNEAIQWQQVTCSRCERTYQCTPEDDYYGVGKADPGPDEGVCFTCLLILSGRNPETTPVTVLYADGTKADPRDGHG